MPNKRLGSESDAPIAAVMNKRIGLFYGIAFFAGGMIDLGGYLITGKTFAGNPRFDPTLFIVFALSLVFFVSAILPKLAVLQPIIFLVLVPFGFADVPADFYGLAYFVSAYVILFWMGFFSTHRLVKNAVLLAYLYSVELLSALKSFRFPQSLFPLLFMTLFLVFLFLVYREQIFVYLKEPKPRFSLSEHSLSDAERLYVLATVKGRSTKEIAVDYELSESTVRNTLSRAYKKLGIEDKSELIALAGANELVD